MWKKSFDTLIKILFFILGQVIVSLFVDLDFYIYIAMLIPYVVIELIRLFRRRKVYHLVYDTGTEQVKSVRVK